MSNGAGYDVSFRAGALSFELVTGIMDVNDALKRVDFDYVEKFDSRELFLIANQNRDVEADESGVLIRQSAQALFQKYDDGWRLISLDLPTSDRLTDVPDEGELVAYLADFGKADAYFEDFEEEKNWRSHPDYATALRRIEKSGFGVLIYPVTERWGPMIPVSVRGTTNWRSRCDDGVFIRSPKTGPDGLPCSQVSGSHPWFQARGQGYFGLCRFQRWWKKDGCDSLNADADLYVRQWDLLINAKAGRWFDFPLGDSWSPRFSIPLFPDRRDTPWYKFAWKGCLDQCEGDNGKDSGRFRGQGFIRICAYTGGFGGSRCPKE